MGSDTLKCSSTSFGARTYAFSIVVSPVTFWWPTKATSSADSGLRKDFIEVAYVANGQLTTTGVHNRSRSKEYT